MTVNFNTIGKFCIICMIPIASFLSTNVNAEIIEVQDAKMIGTKISELKKGDMVLFDVRDVLFRSTDQVLTHEHKSVFKQKFVEIEEKLGKDEAIRLRSIVLTSYKPVLVDNEMPKIIREAQKSGIIAFGLTSGKTNEYGIIKNRADLRIKMLKDFGIDFSKSMDLPYISLGDAADENSFENGNSIFKDGVIFASRLPKGEILGRFLKETKLKPSKIIFVDNQLKNINLVAEKCNDLGIEYVGIYFTKSSKKPHTYLDQNIVDKKFDILLNQDKWISDEDAKVLLEQK